MEMLLTFFASFMEAPFLDAVTAVAVATLVGGMIGIEREYRDKSAGFRTMILISVGSCLFTVFSHAMGDQDGETTRIAASVVAGIGFLGAGVIVKDGPTIRGLTTAASIWLVASLGMGAGIGEYLLVLSVTVLALVVLFILPPFERWLDRLHDFSEFHITIKNSDVAEGKILDILESLNVEVVEVRRTKMVKDERILHIKATMDVAQHEELGVALVESSAVIAFHD